MVQKLRLQKELDVIASKESEVASIQSEYEEILESIAEEDRGEFINEDGTAFVPKEIDKIVKPYSNGKRKPDVGSIEETLLKVKTLMNKEKSLNTEIKNLRIDLHNHTKDLIESLSIDEALPILYEKWIAPIASAISVLPDSIVSALESKIDTLTKKYMESQTAYKLLFADYPDVVNVEQMREMLGGICDKTAYRLLRSGEIRSFIVGRRYRIPKLNILEYLELIDKSNA